jgi:hypothetical protein
MRSKAQIVRKSGEGMLVTTSLRAESSHTRRRGTGSKVSKNEFTNRAIDLAKSLRGE